MANKKKPSAAEESVKDLSEALPTKPKRDRAAASARKAARGARTEQPAKPGMPGSVNDSRRCSATAHRTGERCKAPAIKGSQVCRVHGGAAPQVKRSAKERLLELLDPALASLHKVLTDPDADDSTKVRAALGILDRTGHGPGQKIDIGVSKWDELMEGMKAVPLDRDMDGPAALPSGGGGDHTWEDVDQFQQDAQIESWAEYDAEDEKPYTTRLNPYDGNTVHGEVVQDSILPPPPDTRGVPSEHDRHPTTWPYGDRKHT
ncbi:hypothetical protein [Nocardioides sp. LHG3406-4]|uniref:hypothetical protein n=1 Tax=Nocardioides sp. LHG3406-4 TaxID=2804575 RepID=UPI003CF99487